MKILILGHGRHGKDTVAEMLQDRAGITFQSSSQAASEIAVFPALSALHGYKTPAECFADRANHREEWKTLISGYNTPDKGRLCREILKTSDCYVGMRCPLELAATRHLFGLILWVDASQRVASDPSMGIERDQNMLVIDNNGTQRDLEYEVYCLARIVGNKAAA
jgi:hypothetical protein